MSTSDLTLKKIALHNAHIEMGAKMVPFAGFNMPLQYENLIKEHLNVRNNVGVFDVSHMGEFLVKGERALDLLQWVTSNNVANLKVGKVQYSCLPNDQGGIVDDLLVYQLGEQEYLLVVNASNIEKDWEWIQSHNTFGAELSNVSDQYSLLAVQGPNALSVLQKITPVKLESIPYYHFQVGIMAQIPDVIISNTGYTGAGGFELYVKNSDAQQLFDAVFNAGKDCNIMPAGLGCRDTLRLEKGFCLYGNDIDDTTSPIEAGLGWITKFSKPFIHDQYHKEIKEQGASQKLVGFIMVDKGIPRKDYLIKDAQNNTIGRVTSGTQSPSLQKAIGLGYVNAKNSFDNSEIYIDIRGKLIKAQITKIPFI